MRGEVPRNVAQRTTPAKRNRFTRGNSIDRPSELLVRRSIGPTGKPVYIKLSLRARKRTRSALLFQFMHSPLSVRFALTPQPRYNEYSHRTCRIRPVY